MDKPDSMPVFATKGRQGQNLPSRTEDYSQNQLSLWSMNNGAEDSGYASQNSSASLDSSVNNVAESLRAHSISNCRLVAIDSDDCYSMTHVKRGKCIIFNNKTFDENTDMPPRPGSDVDAKNMYDVFRNVLQFDVEICHDQTTLQMLQKVADVANLDHRDSDCFALVILSHGDEGIVYGKDGFMKLELLVEPLKGDGCPSLIGKPKLVFIQACRGERHDLGVNAPEAKPDEEEPPPSKQSFKIPAEADFLYAFSSAPGFYSFRNSTKGSWFVQAITDIFQRHGTELEILQLMTRVNRTVAFNFESKSKNKEHSGKKQIPSIVSLLTKELYFRKK